jgi:hypothetical protein
MVIFNGFHKHIWTPLYNCISVCCGILYRCLAAICGVFLDCFKGVFQALRQSIWLPLWGCFAALLMFIRQNAWLPVYRMFALVASMVSSMVMKFLHAIGRLFDAVFKNAQNIIDQLWESLFRPSGRN